MNNMSAWLVQKLLNREGPQYASIREYDSGQNIFRVGDPGEYLAVLLSGSVEIRKDGKLLLVVEHGGMFGEMGLIDGQPRSADAEARSHCQIAEIRERQFLALIEATPHFSLAVMRILTERLRRHIES